MRLKLDENLGLRAAQIVRAAEPTLLVDTIASEGLSGASDQVIYDMCVREQRCLVSLDLDFADIIRFPPHNTAGIVVIRLPKERFHGHSREIGSGLFDYVGD